MTVQPHRPNFIQSLDTKAAVDCLSAASIGDTVLFTALSAALGRPVEGGDPNIQSALRSLVKDGILFDNVRGVGYKRLSDSEVVNTAERERAGLRRKARRAIRRLSCVADFATLPNELKIKHNAALSGFGAIAALMTSANTKKLESAVEKTNAQLPLAKTLEAFRA